MSERERGQKQPANPRTAGLARLTKEETIYLFCYTSNAQSINSFSKRINLLSLFYPTATIKIYSDIFPFQSIPKEEEEKKDSGKSESYAIGQVFP